MKLRNRRDKVRACRCGMETRPRVLPEIWVKYSDFVHRLWYSSSSMTDLRSISVPFASTQIEAWTLGLRVTRQIGSHQSHAVH